MPPPGEAASLPLDALPIIPRTVYIRGGLLAKGGLGTIVKARDVRLHRPVAIKELISTADESVVDRFVREIFITSRLQHPSIIPVHEAGRWPSGEPFLAMKLVRGRSLAEVMDEAQTLVQRLALLPHLLAVADAIAHAHSERVVHRDLKPGNILVGRFGETVVIDWGLAKDLTADDEAPLTPARDSLTPEDDEGSTMSHRLTIAGSIMGTPEYMPPEQACALPVDERADVYAIGALLYRALCGVPPYQGPDGLDVVAQVIAGPPKPLSARQKGLPEDLLAIVQKAMAREPARRYPSAKELAEDLRRFQTGQIVGAHRYSRAELVRRFLRRYRAPLIVAASATVVLGAIGIWSVERIIRERNAARQSEAEAQERRLEAQQKQSEATRRADELTLSQARGLVDRDPNEAVAWLKTLSAKSPRWPAARTLAADAQARGIGRVFRTHAGGINTVTFSPDGRSIATASDDRTLRIWDLETGKDRVFEGHEDEIWSAAFSPDGKLLASGGKDKTLRLWNLATGTPLILAGHQQWLTSVRFSPDGQWVTSQGLSEGVWLWNVASRTGKRIAKNAGVEMTRGAVFSSDSRTLAFVERGKLVLWDLASGKGKSFSGQGPTCSSIALSADGRLIATGATDGSVRLWSPSKGVANTFEDHNREVTALAFLPDGSAVVSGSKDRTVRIVNLSSGKGRVLGRYGGEIKTIQVSPDGTRVAAVGQDRTVALWDLATGEGKTLGGFQDWLSFNGVAFSPDGKRLAAAGFDHTMRVWNIGGPMDRRVDEHDGAATVAVFSPDGQRVVSGGADGAVSLTHLGGGAPSILDKHDGKVLDLRIFPDGASVVSAGEDGTVRILPLNGDKPRILRGHQGRVSRIAISTDGKQLASGGADKKVRLWDLTTGKAQVLFEHASAVEALAFSPDGASLATGSADNSVRLHRFATGAVETLGKFERLVRAVTFSPDGKTLAAGSRDHTIRLWNLETRENKVIASGNVVTQIVFLPGGATFASVGSEPSVRLWETSTGKPLGILRGHQSSVESISISPDGKRIASASQDGTLRIWDLANNENRQLPGHEGGTQWVSFSPDGRMLVSAGADKAVRLWRDDLPEDEAGLRAWLEAATPDKVALDENR
jgi:WD40 repeat protein/tRNA A-37 threonylcarbamoyl transferase component Bud32